MMGDERLNRFLEAFNEDAPTSIRLNPQTLGDGSFLFENDSASKVQTKKYDPFVS